MPYQSPQVTFFSEPTNCCKGWEVGIECSPEAAYRTNSQVDVGALSPMMTGRRGPQGVAG